MAGENPTQCEQTFSESLRLGSRTRSRRKVPRKSIGIESMVFASRAAFHRGWFAESSPGTMSRHRHNRISNTKGRILSGPVS